MGRGPGWLERAILDLLGINEYLSAPLLAAKAYTADAPDAPDPPPDEAIDPTPAQRAAVRRALSKLQKRGLVVKLGSRYPGERCSYADREHALTIGCSTSDCNSCGIIHGEFKNCMPTRLRARHEPTPLQLIPPTTAVVMRAAPEIDLPK